MKSIFFGHSRTGEKMHTVQFFDGQLMREIDATVTGKSISWLNRAVPGVIEIGMDYETAKRKLAAYEKAATRC